MTTTYDIHSDVSIFNYDYEIPVFLLIIACFMVPIGTYICFHDTEKYRNITSDYQKLWRHFAYMGVFYVVVLVFCATARSGYHVYSMDSVGDLSVDCVGGDSGCCEVFHQCSEGVADTLDHDIYVFNLEDTKCPRLVDMIQFHDTTACEKSMYGCCMIQTSCDSYVRLNYPYSSYQNTLDHGDVGYVATSIQKTDANGTNCPTDIEYVQEYIGSHYESYAYHNVFLILLVLCIFSIPCCFCKDAMGEKAVKQWNTWSDKVDCDLHGHWTRNTQADGELEEVPLSDSPNKQQEADYDILP